jgi:hypothetical protein
VLEEQAEAVVDLRDLLWVHQRGGDEDLSAAVGQLPVELDQVVLEVGVEFLGEGVGRDGAVPGQQSAGLQDVGDVVAGVEEAQRPQHVQLHQRGLLHVVHFSHHFLDEVATHQSVEPPFDQLT